MWDVYTVALCGKEVLIRRVATRFGRALTLAVSGLRMNATLVAPNADYDFDFERDSDRFLADVSLTPHGVRFDEAFDDRLAPIILAEMRGAHGDRPLKALKPERGSHDWKIVTDVVAKNGVAIRQAQKEAARDLIDQCGFSARDLRRAVGLER